MTDTDNVIDDLIRVLGNLLTACDYELHPGLFLDALGTLRLIAADEADSVIGALTEADPEGARRILAGF